MAQERARQEQTRREATRLKTLAEEKAISQKEFDDAISAQKLSDATLQAAEANLRQAELNLSYTRVTAPVSGVADAWPVPRQPGDRGQESSLLTTMNQVDPIWVRFSLSESDLATLPDKRLDRIKSAEVRLALPDGSPYPVKGRLNFAATRSTPGSPRRSCARNFAIRACACFPASSCGSRWRRASATTCSSCPRPR